jgi:hypothetical protein
MAPHTPGKEIEAQHRKVLERLLLVWNANPHLRLGQLLHRSVNGVHIEYALDDELLGLVEACLPKVPWRAQPRE